MDKWEEAKAELNDHLGFGPRERLLVEAADEKISVLEAAFSQVNEANDENFAEITRLKEELDILKRLRCQADRDGECHWEHCPQLRDGEPDKSERNCPLAYGDDDYE